MLIQDDKSRISLINSFLHDFAEVKLKNKNPDHAFY